MIFLRTELGAVKSALRDLLREALTVVENFIASGLLGSRVRTANRLRMATK